MGAGGICCTNEGCDCAVLVELYKVLQAGEGGISSEVLMFVERRGWFWSSSSSSMLISVGGGGGGCRGG